MSRRRAALGLCALLGAAVLVLAISRMARRADETIGVSSGTQHPGSVPALESHPAPDAPVKAGEPAAPDPASGAISGWTLRGRVLRHADPDAAEPDTPVGGALIRLGLAPDPEPGDPASDFPVREVRSEPNGKLTLESVAGNARARYRLEVDADGCALRAMTLDLPAAVEGGAKDIPDIVLEEPVILVVHLRGPGGQPVEDGKVSASLHEGFHSSEEPLYLWEDGCEAAHRGGGAYVLERAPRGSIYVEASAPGFVDDWETIALPLDRPLEMLLRRGLRLTGTVRSSAGEPLEGAEVVAGTCVAHQSVRTTAGGRFELQDLPDGACLLTASADGFGSMKREVEPGVGSIDFVLSPEAVIAGRVLSSESRRPLEGAEIRGDWEDLVTTDGTGAFEIPKLPAGTYRLSVFHEGHVPRALEELDLEEGERAEGIEVLLEEGLSVAGRVVGAGGRPLAGAGVSAHWSPPGEGSGPDIDQDALTDEDGSFTLAGLVEGEYTVQVLADGYCRLTRECRVPESDQEVWTFALERGGSIRGRVLDPEGRPTPRATLHLGYPRDDQSRIHLPRRYREGAPADRLGRYCLEGLQAFERYCILVTDRERRFAPAWKCEIALVPGEQVDLPDIRLRGGGSIRGRVLDTAGNPLPGVKVGAQPDRDREQRLRWKLIPEETTFPSSWRYSFIPHRETSTGPQGEYELRWLLGRYEIGVSLGGRVAPASKEVDVDEGVRLENVDFILPRGTAVSGRVIDTAGQPVQGAEVTVSRPCFVGASATTDAEGRFEVEGLGAGSGYITVSRSGHTARSIRCEIPSSGNVLSLDRQPVITGRIAVSAGTERPPVCEVRTVTYSGFLHWGTSDGTGRFTVSAPPGACFIGAEAEGFFCDPLRLDLKTGERREVVLTVERAGIVEVELDFEGREEEEKLPDGTFVILEKARAHAAPLREDVYYGDCTFAAVPPGEVALIACVPGRGIARKEGITVTAGETEEVRIEVPRVQGLFGIVTRRAEAVRGARVVARGAGKPATARTSSSGFYEIRDLEPGAYEVTFEEEDGASGPPVRKRTTVLEGGAQELDAELGAAVVSGLVTSGGEPVPGAQVIADNWVGTSWSEATTDAAGAWSLELEVPGEYVLQAFRAKEAVGPSRELVLEEGQAESRVDLEIEKE